MNKISLSKDLKKALLISTIACLPVTGFIYGFISCTDCGNGISSIAGRMFLGVIYSFFTVVSLGKPWTGNSGFVSSTNLRLYVILAFIVLALIYYLLLQLKRKDKL